MADLEKVIKGLECCIKSISECQCTDGCPYEDNCWGQNSEADDGDPMYLDLMRDALTMLKAQQTGIAELEAAQTARVMTLGEIRKADCVWLEVKHWEENLLDVTIYRGETDRTFNFEYGFCQMTELYGRQWRCWTSKPTDEQRKAVKWDE